MAKKQKLKGWKRLGCLDEIRDLTASAGRILSARNEADISIDVVEAASDATVNTLMKIEETAYPDWLRYAPGHLRSLIAKKDSTLFIASADGIPAGLNLSYHDDEEYDPETYYIDDLAIAQNAQGKGIGSALLRLGFVAASRLGYKDSVLLCEEINEHGIELPEYYRSLGMYQYDEATGLGVPMCMDLTPEAVAGVIAKLKGE